MIDHDVQWFDVTMHDSVNMRVLERLQNHVCVQPNIHVVELAGEDFRLNARNAFKDERWGFGGRVSEDVKEFDDIWPTVESLQDLDLPILFLDADGFENFYHTLGVVGKICSFVDFTVLATAKLVVNVVVVELAPGKIKTIIIRVASRSLTAYELEGTFEHFVLDLLRLLFYFFPRFVGLYHAFF